MKPSKLKTKNADAPKSAPAKNRTKAVPVRHTAKSSAAAEAKKTNLNSRSNAAEWLPDEVLLTLFSYLDASDLLVAARVCRRWSSISDDNVLWKKMFDIYLSKTKAGKDLGIPLETPTSWWKKQCFERSKQFRDARARNKLSTLDPYTLLPKNYQQNLKELGVRYTLMFKDRSGTHHYLKHDDCFFHRMSLTARWYKFDNLPPPGRIQSLKLLALLPVFYDQKGVACKQSPCQRSMLYETVFDWSKLTSSDPVASDSAIDVYVYRPGLAVATWKDGGGLAFIAANFIYDNLIERCLKGTFTQALPHQPHQLTVQQLRGSAAYNTSITIELRNMRSSIWSQQFRNVDLGADGSTRAINPERREEHSPLDKIVEFPWKTDLFKNKVPNMGIIDVALRDGGGRLIWCVSDFVQSIPNDQAKVSYDYEDQGRIINYSNGYKLELVMDKDSDGDKQVVSSLTIRR